METDEKYTKMEQKFNRYLRMLDEMNARLSARNSDLWTFIEILAKENNQDKIKDKSIKFLANLRKSSRKAYKDELLEESD